jgi:21S rRNA (GM2251-2'-O)-methyltransferase
MSVTDTNAFLADSRASGWRVLAAMPPDSTLGHIPSLQIPTSLTSGVQQENLAAQHPMIVLLGGEAKGISPWLTKHVDLRVSIDRHVDTSVVGVDSLNVSVAAALVCAEVTRRPPEEEIARLVEKPKMSPDEGNMIF